MKPQLKYGAKKNALWLEKSEIRAKITCGNGIMGIYCEDRHEDKQLADALKEAFLGAFATAAFLMLFYAFGRLRSHGAGPWNAAVASLAALPYAACVAYIALAPKSVKRSVASARIATRADKVLFALVSAVELAAFYMTFRFLDMAFPVPVPEAAVSAAVFFAALSGKMAYYKYVKFPRRIHTASSIALYAAGVCAAAAHPFYVYALLETAFPRLVYL